MKEKEVKSTKTVEDSMDNVSNKVENATKGLDSQLGGVTKWIESMLKQLPEFPKGVAVWLGKYLWILVAIASVVGLVTGVGALFTLDRLFNPLKYVNEGQFGAFYTALAARQYTALEQVATIISIVGGLVQSVIGAVAITPLKNNRMFGWKLLYWSTLVGLITNVVYGILYVNIVSIAFTLLFGALALWIVFGIRDQFTKK